MYVCYRPPSKQVSSNHSTHSECLAVSVGVWHVGEYHREHSAQLWWYDSSCLTFNLITIGELGNVNVDPTGSERRASRNASSTTITSSTPTPRKMNGPSCARLVNGTPHHITSPYPIKIARNTALIPHPPNFAKLIEGWLLSVVS